MKMNKYFVSEEGAALIEKAMRIKGKRTNHNKKCMLRAYNSGRKKTIIYIGNGLECFKKYIEIMINPVLRNQYDDFDITTVYEETHKKPINIYKMYWITTMLLIDLKDNMLNLNYESKFFQIKKLFYRKYLLFIQNVI